MVVTEWYFALRDGADPELIKPERGAAMIWGGIKDGPDPDWLVEDGAFTVIGVLAEMDGEWAGTLIDWVVAKVVANRRVQVPVVVRTRSLALPLLARKVLEAADCPHPDSDALAEFLKDWRCSPGFTLVKAAPYPKALRGDLPIGPEKNAWIPDGGVKAPFRLGWSFSARGPVFLQPDQLSIRKEWHEGWGPGVDHNFPDGETSALILRHGP